MVQDLFRAEMFRLSSVWEYGYTHKMWLGVFCIIVFGGDFGICIRSLYEDIPTNSSSGKTNESNAPDHDGWLPMNQSSNSARMQFITGNNLKVDQLGSQSRLRCGHDDLEISESIPRYLPNGMPVFRVQITNTCIDCSLTDIHVACGEWASQVLVNPNIFRRIGHNDCLVNNGNALAPQDMVFFEYSNSFPYSLSVALAHPVCN